MMNSVMSSVVIHNLPEETHRALKAQAVLHGRLEQEVLPLFEGRVLSFDLTASQVYAGLMVRARAEGQAISKADGYIVATAAARGYTMVSRDVSLSGQPMCEFSIPREDA